MKTKSKRYKAKWRSDRSERAFREADAQRWKRATSTPAKAVDVATSFGSTRVYHWPGDGPSVVLLHGVGDTSVRWVPIAESLVELNVFAVDIMGDVGESVPADGFASAADYGTWLAEVIDGLGVTAPHVVGHSLGGYVALSHAVQGTSMGSTVLFDPVGVVELKMLKFIVWGLKTAVAFYSPGPIRRRLAERVRQPLLNDKADAAVHFKGARGHPMQLPPLPVFDDDQLAAIAHPVRVVGGEHSPMFDSAGMIERMTHHVARCEARVLPGAGHAFVMSHPDECLAEIRAAVAGVTGEHEAAMSEC